MNDDVKWQEREEQEVKRKRPKIISNDGNEHISKRKNPAISQACYSFAHKNIVKGLRGKNNKGKGIERKENETVPKGALCKVEKA